MMPVNPEKPFGDGGLSMDRQTRNARLYGTLLEMGLVVYPVPDEFGSIDCFIVSTGMYSYEYNPTKFDLLLPGYSSNKAAEDCPA